MAALPSLLLDADASQSCRWIENFLHHHLFHEAAFLAERLPAFPEVEDGRVLELWAEALLSAGEHSRLRHQLQGLHCSRSLSPRVQYLLALACIRLEHYDEAEVALLAGNIDLLEKWRNGQLQPLEHVVEGAAGAYQLGRAAEGMGRKHLALECYAECLKQCPYMWGAFERFSWLSLCRQDSRPGQSCRDFVDAALNPSNKASTTLSGACVAVPGEDIVARGWTPRTPRKRRRRSGQCDLAFKNARDFLTKKGQQRICQGHTAVTLFSSVLMCKALEILSKLPSHERDSAFCQDLAARCNFELQNYRDAAILYKPLTQSRSPDRLELGLLSREVLERLPWTSLEPNLRGAVCALRLRVRVPNSIIQDVFRPRKGFPFSLRSGKLVQRDL
ncbi:Cell division cycle protein 27-like B [Symbiodinium microadriaticum]|uniref:Cell division cycle protein 27-like B n=1 Tax=Symbiodinium microadriaticum TaxID=2951 RepID=A0A1Q9CSW2_SYMMI|nr:Cell division cycle protein 27-like B [Symbiodinium microadriaticum]